LNGLVLVILDLLLDLIQPDGFLDDEMVGRVSLKVRRESEVSEPWSTRRVKGGKESRTNLLLDGGLEDSRVRLIRIFVSKSDDPFVNGHETGLSGKIKKAFIKTRRQRREDEPKKWTNLQSLLLRLTLSTLLEKRMVGRVSE